MKLITRHQSRYRRVRRSSFAVLGAVSLCTATLVTMGSSASQAATLLNASTWAQLSHDFTSASPGSYPTIRLTADIASPLGAFLNVPSHAGSGGTSIALDLNGHHLTVTAPNSEEQAAISVYQGASLTIKDSIGSGSLTAVGNYLEPGIGAAYNVTNVNVPADQNMGHITIAGGHIDAIGGGGASGIGTAYYFGGGSITITGGVVVAQGGSEASGIGNGWLDYWTNQGMTIAIQGGSVIAAGGVGGSGIGWSLGSETTGPAISVGGCAKIEAIGGPAGFGIEDWVAGGAGIGGGPSYYAAHPSPTLEPVVAAPALRIDGVAIAGSSTSAGGGGPNYTQDFSSMPGAPASTITMSGNTAYRIAIQSIDGPNTQVGGQFLMTCTRMVPNAPRSLHVKRKGTELSFSWKAPLANGGPNVVSYSVTVSPGSKHCTTSQTSCSLQGLNPHKRYVVSVTATNRAGSGSAIVLHQTRG